MKGPGCAGAVKPPEFDMLAPGSQRLTLPGARQATQQRGISVRSSWSSLEGSLYAGASGWARRSLAVVAAAAVVTVALSSVWVCGVSATPVFKTSAPVDEPCTVRLAMARDWGNTPSSILARKVSISGHTAHVDWAHLSLVTPPSAFSDIGRTQLWRSLIWAVPLVYPTSATAAPGAAAVLSAIGKALAANPDPGSATAAARARGITHGWEEGTNTRREQGLNCLVAATRNPALTRALRAAVAANLDMVRYYGPPYHPIHNHGTMANLALLDSATVLATPAWAKTAVTRLKAEMTGLFSPSGFTLEQSTAYHPDLLRR